MESSFQSDSTCSWTLSVIKKDKNNYIMSEDSFLINKDSSFKTVEPASIEETRVGLLSYHNGFDKAKNLDSEFPIFLDANILLNYYGMSEKDKKKLKKFFESKKEQIHITNQIQVEFQRNRLDAINDYFTQLNEIKIEFRKSLQIDVKNKFNKLLESKIIQRDYPQIRRELTKIFRSLKKSLFENEELVSKIDTKIDETLNRNKELEFIDPILEVYDKFTLSPKLEESEISFLIKEFNEMLDKYSEYKDSQKLKFAFPGCGEKKKDEKYGDYIIFHEMVKFMKTNQQNAIFLTNDVRKSDWIKKDKKQFIHYIEKAYKLSGKLLYIFDATDLLDMISFDNIYKVKAFQEMIDPDNILSVQDFKLREFQLIVNSIQDFIRTNLGSESKVESVKGRNFNNHTVDLIISEEDKLLETILVYHTNHNNRKYIKNLQKRVDALNDLYTNDLSPFSTLFVVHTNQDEDQNNYEDLTVEFPLRIQFGRVKLNEQEKMEFNLERIKNFE